MIWMLSKSSLMYAKSKRLMFSAYSKNNSWKLTKIPSIFKNLSLQPPFIFMTVESLWVISKSKDRIGSAKWLCKVSLRIVLIDLYTLSQNRMLSIKNFLIRFVLRMICFDYEVNLSHPEIILQWLLCTIQI